MTRRSAWCSWPWPRAPIIYVIVQLLDTAYRAGRRRLLYLGLLASLTGGFRTNMVAAGGAA